MIICFDVKRIIKMSPLFKISHRYRFLLNIFLALALCLSCSGRKSQKKAVNTIPQKSSRVRLTTLETQLKDLSSYFNNKKCISRNTSINWAGHILQLNKNIAGDRAGSNKSLNVRLIEADGARKSSHKLPACIFKYYKLKQELFFIAREGSGGFLSFHRLSLKNAGYKIKSFDFRDQDLFEQNSMLNELHQGRDRVNFDGVFLLREFPFFKPEDPNCCPTGGTIKVLYRYDNGYFSIKRTNVKGRIVL